MIPSVMIIGPGKLGTSLFRAILEDKKSSLILVGKEELKDPHPFIKKNISLYRSGLKAKDIKTSDIIFITVPDAVIAQVAGDLEQFDLNGKYIFHTSGAQNSDILNSLRKAVKGSLHPIQTFNKPFMNRSLWRDIVCTYEGDMAGEEMLKRFFKDLGSKIITVTKQQKIALHLAAVVAANYQVALLTWAEKILQREGLDGLQAKEIIAPITARVQQNYVQNSLGNILSGPVLRGDVETLKKHLKYLKDKKSYSEIELYKKLALWLTDQEIFDIKNRREIQQLLNTQ